MNRRDLHSVMTCVALSTLVLLILVTGCSGGGSGSGSGKSTGTTPPALSVTTSSVPAGTVGTAYSATLAATGGTGSGYTWSVTAGTNSLSNVGLSLAGAGKISGTPTAAESAASFTVQVTDSSGNTATATLSLTIAYPALSITTTNIPDATVSAAYSESFAATGGSGHYTWSLTSGATGLTSIGLSLSTGGILSGTPSSAGNYPFTVEVTDTTTSATQSAPFTLVVNSAVVATCTHDGSANAILKGNYAFDLSGYDPKGNAYFVIGDFLANGAGAISNGTADANGSAFTTAEQQYSFSGTYSAGDSANDNRGNTSWTNSNTSATGLPAKTTYCFASDALTGGVAYSGWMIEADGSGYVLTGYFEIQDPSYFKSATLKTGYVLGYHGYGNQDPLNRSAGAGFIKFNGSGAIDGGQMDFAEYDNTSQSTNYQAQVAVNSSGSSYTLGSNGRGTATISTASGTLSFVYYLVGVGQEFVTLSSGAGNTGVVSGTGFLQSKSSFTAADVTGSSVFREIATSNPTAPPLADSVSVGQYTFGSSSVSETWDQNSGGVISLDQTATGTYSVTSNGYVTISGIGTHPPHFYLNSPDSGFGIDASNGAGFYYMEQQTKPSGGFTSAGLAGSTFSFGTLFPAAYSDNASNGYPMTKAGTVSFESGGLLSGTQDTAIAPGSASDTAFDAAINDTYAIDATVGAATGRVIFSESGAPIVVGYMVSPDIFFLIDVNSGKDSLILDGDHQ